MQTAILCLVPLSLTATSLSADPSMPVWLKLPHTHLFLQSFTGERQPQVRYYIKMQIHLF